jgi:hypothetical protein
MNGPRPGRERFQAGDRLILTEVGMMSASRRDDRVLR